MKTHPLCCNLHPIIPIDIPITFFSFLLFFSLNLYESKESQTDTREKENKNNNE